MVTEERCIMAYQRDLAKERRENTLLISQKMKLERLLLEKDQKYTITVNRKDRVIRLLRKVQQCDGYMITAAFIAGMILEYLFITNYSK